MKRFLLTLLLVVLIAGCGGGVKNSEVSRDELTDELTAVEKLLYSDSYVGHLSEVKSFSTMTSGLQKMKKRLKDLGCSVCFEQEKAV